VQKWHGATAVRGGKSMARPRQPLISRSAAVAAAIKIIDEEGLEALSLPRLAQELGVKAPSLYYHFADKSAILAAVSRAIIAQTVVPRKPGPERWPEWFVQVSVNSRKVILRHRNAAPLLLQYLPRQLLTEQYEDAARFLEANGVPASLHVQILDGLETLTYGSAIAEAMGPPNIRKATFPGVETGRYPALARAQAANPYTTRKLFEESIRNFLRGVLGPADVLERYPVA